MLNTSLLLSISLYCKLVKLKTAQTLSFPNRATSRVRRVRHVSDWSDVARPGLAAACQNPLGVQNVTLARKLHVPHLTLISSPGSTAMFERPTL